MQLLLCAVLCGFCYVVVSLASLLLCGVLWCAVFAVLLLCCFQWVVISAAQLLLSSIKYSLQKKKKTRIFNRGALAMWVYCVKFCVVALAVWCSLLCGFHHAVVVWLLLYCSSAV